MPKRSRRPVRGAPSPARPAAAAPTTPRTTPVEERPTRPTRSRRTRRQSPFERYRGWIIGATAVAGVLVLGFVFFQGTITQAYTCDSQLTPGPVESVAPRPSIIFTPSPATASPAPSVTAGAPGSPSASGSPALSGSPSASVAPAGSPSPSGSPPASATAQPSPAPEPTLRLGFSTAVIGREHVRTGTPIEYGFCPPTSGDHYNDPPRGPIPPNFYPANEERNPGGWVHNLEHGFVALLYRCPGGVVGGEGCPTQAEMEQMREFFNNPPAAPSGCPKKVLVLRFDSMTTQFALVSWGRALMMDDFDLDTALTFTQQWQEHESLSEGRSCQ